jgi:hypothetical protein
MNFALCFLHAFFWWDVGHFHPKITIATSKRAAGEAGCV